MYSQVISLCAGADTSDFEYKVQKCFYWAFDLSSKIELRVPSCSEDKIIFRLNFHDVQNLLAVEWTGVSECFKLYKKLQINCERAMLI